MAHLPREQLAFPSEPWDVLRMLTYSIVTLRSRWLVRGQHPFCSISVLLYVKQISEGLTQEEY